MADTIQIIKDANGKSIEVNISKICDINGDAETSSSIKDSAIKNRINFEHDIKLVDSKGETLDSAKLLNDIKNGSTNVVALDVDVEATHSGKNHNYCVYYEDSMEKDSESFMNPFHKPVLKNHDDYCEPIGRITQSYAGPSALTDERSAIHLKTHITDQDAIPKFIDGRYRTVSIGGSMGTVTCNICGKTILKDGKFHFCGHWRGETYKDQVCYWGARDIEYHEVSIVNNPADDFAQIMKVTVLTDKDTQNDNKEENSMGGSDSQETNVDNIIDQTLGSENQAQQAAPIEDQGKEEPSTGSEQPKEEQQEEKPVENSEEEKPEDGQQEEQQQEQEEQSEQEEETPEQKEKPEEEGSDSQIANLQQQLKDANEKIESLQNELIDSQSQVQTLTKNIEDAKKETENYKQRCITLATANKEFVVDNIMSTEKFDSEDSKKERKNDLMIKSMKELKAMQDSITQAPRQLAKVDNPTLAIEPKDSNSNNADTDKKDNQIVTVNDAAQEVIKRLLNQNN